MVHPGSLVDQWLGSCYWASYRDSKPCQPGVAALVMHAVRVVDPDLDCMDPH